MTDYLDKMNEAEDLSIVQEAVVPMRIRQTRDFMDRHYDPHAHIDNEMSLHEGFNLLRDRINQKVHEKNCVV